MELKTFDSLMKSEGTNDIDEKYNPLLDRNKEWLKSV